jgi:hypothetical protein
MLWSDQLLCLYLIQPVTLSHVIDELHGNISFHRNYMYFYRRKNTSL